MLYDGFMRICEERGVSPSRVLSELNISRGSLGRWKEGGDALNETKKKIADYFGITIKQLMSGRIEKTSAKTEVNGDTELWELREELRRNPDMRTLFSLGKNMTAKDLKKAVKIIETMCGEDADGGCDY